MKEKVIPNLTMCCFNTTLMGVLKGLADDAKIGVLREAKGIEESCINRIEKLLNPI